MRSALTKPPFLLALFPFLLMASPVANAANPATTTFQVTATVVASCTVAATDLAFGNYDPVTSSPTPGTSTVTVTCTNGAAYTVGLDNGGHYSSSTRHMIGGQGGTELLAYGLYQDLSHSTAWGDTVGVDRQAGTGSGAEQALTVYGLIPAQQAVHTGSFSDTINVSVYY
jgi:spore coat protein U-like protein